MCFSNVSHHNYIQTSSICIKPQTQNRSSSILTETSRGLELRMTTLEPRKRLDVQAPIFKSDKYQTSTVALVKTVAILLPKINRLYGFLSSQGSEGPCIWGNQFSQCTKGRVPPAGLPVILPVGPQLPGRVGKNTDSGPNQIHFATPRLVQQSLGIIQPLLTNINIQASFSSANK